MNRWGISDGCTQIHTLTSIYAHIQSHLRTHEITQIHRICSCMMWVTMYCGTLISIWLWDFCTVNLKERKTHSCVIRFNTKNSFFCPVFNLEKKINHFFSKTTLRKDLVEYYNYIPLALTHFTVLFYILLVGFFVKTYISLNFGNFLLTKYYKNIFPFVFLVWHYLIDQHNILFTFTVEIN